MSLHIPGLQTESWFGANWVEGRKDGRPFFMNVITGETTHVRPKIQQQEQIAALTADQVLGDLPIQTPGKRAKGLPQAHPQRRTGLHASSVEGGGGSGGGVSYAGAGAGSLYIPQPTQSQGIFGTGLGANTGGSQLRSNNRDHIGGGTLSDEDGPEDIDMEATLGAFDHLDLMDGVEFNTGPPLGFPPSGSLSPLSGREIPKNMRHSRVSRPASRELAGTVHAAARRTNSTHSSSSRDGIGSHSRSATKGGNDSSSATGVNDDATRKRRRRTAERLQQRKLRDAKREQTIQKLTEQVQNQDQQIAVLSAENAALKQQISFLQDLVKNSMMQQKK